MHTHTQALNSQVSSAEVTKRITDSPVEVTLPSGESSIWKISQNLTDRWGDLNGFMAPNEAYQMLASDEALYASLQEQMVWETTFIVRKDEIFGVLFELEFCTQHSETDLIGNENSDLQSCLSQYPTESDSKVFLLKAIAELEPQFPNVQFCLPHREEMVNERMGIWAFVPDGALTIEQGKILYDALHKFY